MLAYAFGVIVLFFFDLLVPAFLRALILAYKPLLAISVFCLRVCSHTCCSFWFSFCMPLAFPSSHSKCLTCRLAVWFLHRTFHSFESCTKRSFAWTTSGLWSLEVGASSCIILLSTGCCETSLTAFVLANFKGYVFLFNRHDISSCVDFDTVVSFVHTVVLTTVLLAQSYYD